MVYRFSKQSYRTNGLIAHGLGASKSDFINLSGFLSSNGFNVLLFDFRAHGESG